MTKWIHKEKYADKREKVTGENVGFSRMEKLKILNGQSLSSDYREKIKSMYIVNSSRRCGIQIHSIIKLGSYSHFKSIFHDCQNGFVFENSKSHVISKSIAQNDRKTKESW